MAIDNNGWQLLSINRLILIIDGQLIMKIFVIIDYHRLSMSIDKWWESNIIDCHQCAISIDYLFSQTFQLSISSSTNKVTHFDIIAFYLSKNYLILTTYIGKKKIFEIKANVSCYDSWERESLLPCFVTVCCACHLWRLPGITFFYSVNHSWEFHTEDRGWCGHLHRHIKKEEEKEIVTISLLVFERRLCPRSVESLQWTWS